MVEALTGYVKIHLLLPKSQGKLSGHQHGFDSFDSPLNLFAYSVLSKDYLRMDLSKPPLHIRKNGLCFSPQEKERSMLIVVSVRSMTISLWHIDDQQLTMNLQVTTYQLGAWIVMTVAIVLNSLRNLLGLAYGAEEGNVFLSYFGKIPGWTVSRKADSVMDRSIFAQKLTGVAALFLSRMCEPLRCEPLRA
ncbi:hypothetical protein RRG08_063659 [Elysia crispata]|uniref:Uncharacterized protein n=1 Tax=Elysia crispata TaxID=231223 RepID=A0AAE1DLW9_9GAST|nr:hypothetical protein RRG08_063659 [Elysia crispata]